ncbi:ABC transporter substrate-binding protein, partial [Proteus mirabilis]|uniref:ABC transporter substrate-binding protein n=1 Tax=Proteus mirabilis TaxID=584 RepID=UPI0019540669
VHRHAREEEDRRDCAVDHHRVGAAQMTERTRDQLMPLQIGFIPLVDAAELLVAVDKGFAREEWLDVTLIREVSWSNVRD